MSDVLIECEGLSAGYGQVAVIHDLALCVRAGEVVALIGRNGAGKTSTLLALAGELAPMTGEVRWMGKRTAAPMHVRCRAGLGFLTEERAVVMKLTVADNLRLARVSPADAVELFPALEALLKRPAGLLSGGEQQMLALARALCRGAKVILADELSFGLAPLVVRRLLETLQTAAHEHGVGILLVEQHVRQALAVADRAYVMDRGVVTLSGAAEEMRDRIDEIEATYLSAM